jgi:hypothetical protein
MMNREAQVIETEVATLIIIWKPSATATDQIPTPPYVRDASRLWNQGCTAKEICSELRINVGKGYNAHTEWLNRLRLGYSHLFPLRRAQQKKVT